MRPRAAASILVVSVLLASGCAPEEPAIYPMKSQTTLHDLSEKARPLTEALADIKGLEMEAVVTGTVGKVCRSMGCWFYVADGDALVMVDLAPSGFTIPIDSAGRDCIVRGKITVDGADRRIDARQVALWPEGQRRP